MIWHSEELSNVINILKTDDRKGLSNSEAELRLESYGNNTTSQKKVKSFSSCFFAAFKSFTVIAVLVVAVLSVVVTLITNDKQWFFPLVIFSILILNAAIKAYEEIKTEDTTELLKDISSPTATVIREGIKKVVDASTLVPGDLIFLREGDYISADARLVSASALFCDESPLSASHAPVSKNADASLEDITPLNERHNMVFYGCSVTHGSGYAVVTAVGIESELGKEQIILEQSGSAKLPIKESVSSFSKIFSTVTTILCVLIFIIGMIYNFRNTNISRTLIDTFLNSAALAVAVMPEGLPAAISVIIALGLQRLVTKNIIVKDPSAIETMGGISVICADKTGTLTENIMRVTKVFNGKEIKVVTEDADDDVKMILELATICNDSDETSGDPTGVGIAEACRDVCKKSKLDIENLYPRLSEIPFDSSRKLMTTINMINERPFVIVKGAPETVLSLCNGNCEEKYGGTIEALASEGLRVIAVAAKQIFEIPANPSTEEIECNLKFIGLIGLADRPRSDALSAINDCKAAGIRTIMLTSDHPATALAIGRQMGILSDESELITNVELSAMSDEELTENIEKYSVYARISSADRLRIVTAWQNKGHIVSVTGDSVDDVPALMAADIGCAMGKSGTDVAKGVSDIILTDDDFSSIVNSVKEGRAIFSNIRKILMYLVSSNIAELLFMLLGVIIFGNIPLIASQLLWINLITDLIPVIMLGMEPPERDVMNTAPQRKQTVFNKKLVTGIAYEGLVMTLCFIAAYVIGLLTSVEAAATMAFICAILSQLIFSFSARTENESVIFSLTKNKTSLWALAFSIVVLLFVTLTPIKALFGLCAISIGQWLITILLSLVPFVVNEAVKLIKK